MSLCACASGHMRVCMNASICVLNLRRKTYVRPALSTPEGVRRASV